MIVYRIETECGTSWSSVGGFSKAGHVYYTKEKAEWAMNKGKCEYYTNLYKAKVKIVEYNMEKTK